MGALFRGAAQFGRRWNTVSRSAALATSGMSWIAVAPVPITATRFPVRSRGSCGHRKEWNERPWKLSLASILGRVGVDSTPTAVATKRVVIWRPSWSLRAQVSVSSSNTIASTRQPNCMCSRSPNLSATWSR